MLSSKDIEYIKTVLQAIQTKCNCNDKCRLCELKDFCADRPFTGITSDDFYRNMCFTVIKVIKNNGKIYLVSLEKFLEYLHKNCVEQRINNGCCDCQIRDLCDSTICFTTTPCDWEI